MEKTKIKALIVDDEMGMCIAAKRVLDDLVVKIDNIDTEVSFTVSYITDPEEFKEFFPDSDTSILILDYKLKDCSGIDLMSKYVSNKSDILTIMITAYATFETAVHATKMGAYDFLAKPFTPDELRYAVRKAVHHLMYARHAKKLEEEKRRIRFEFISVLAHELKSPIHAVEGYLDLMEKRFSQLSKDDIINMLRRSRIRIDGMKKLIFDLLDLTRIESGEKKRELREIDIIKLFKDVSETYREDAVAKNISINFEITKNELQFRGDIGEIEMIANNLISNAIKYNRENGNVFIKLLDDEDKIYIEVKDTGIGMNEEEKAKLFNDFVRIKNEKTSHISGSGLGLSTLRKISRLYSGDVVVESQPDVGSVFKVDLAKN